MILAPRQREQIMLLPVVLISTGGKDGVRGGMEIMTPENIAGVYGVRVAVERLADIPVVVPL